MKFSLASVVALGLFGATAINAPMNVVAQQAENLDYVGLGVNAGSLSAISKFSVGENFSIRPVFLGDLDDIEGTILIPLTYDFQPLVGNLRPYAGAGVGTTTEDDFSVGAILTAGVDYPINDNFTANASFNVEIFGDNDVQAIFGIGYNLR